MAKGLGGDHQLLLLRPGWLARTKHQAPLDGLTEATEVYPSKNLNIRTLNELQTERAAPNIRPVVGKVIRGSNINFDFENQQGQ